MAKLKLCSLNVRGFNIPEKRSNVLYDMHKHRVDILLLQETHFRTDHCPGVRNRYYTTWLTVLTRKPKPRVCR